ncbi:MAG: AAA family ATPase [Chitinophagaceae bacterium]|nr:MAG: AAA family ATPase [Chitinophagaceae bacterium]
MNTEQKKQIQALIETHITAYGSQNAAAAALKDVSAATISQIRNENWENISDKMWKSIGVQLGFHLNGNWNTVDTKAAQTLKVFMTDAANFSNVFAITGAAGIGKTHIAKEFSKKQNVFHIACNEFWNKKQFLTEILSKLGVDPAGYNSSDLMAKIVSTVTRMENPLLILDEADKLNDSVLYLFITLYNETEGRLGIILMATDYLQKRITRGQALNKKGYQEIYSRFGRKFIGLNMPGYKDVAMLCKANGVEDEVSINHIWNDCEGDFRRVRRLVLKHKLQNND